MPEDNPNIQKIKNEGEEKTDEGKPEPQVMQNE